MLLMVQLQRVVFMSPVRFQRLVDYGLEENLEAVLVAHGDPAPYSDLLCWFSFCHPSIYLSVYN